MPFLCHVLWWWCVQVNRWTGERCSRYDSQCDIMCVHCGALWASDKSSEPSAPPDEHTQQNHFYSLISDIKQKKSSAGFLRGKCFTTTNLLELRSITCNNYHVTTIEEYEMISYGICVEKQVIITYLHRLNKIHLIHCRRPWQQFKCVFTSWLCVSGL